MWEPTTLYYVCSCEFKISIVSVQRSIVGRVHFLVPAGSLNSHQPIVAMAPISHICHLSVDALDGKGEVRLKLRPTERKVRPGKCLSWQARAHAVGAELVCRDLDIHAPRQSAFTTPRFSNSIFVRNG
jgi:hypothetical protein